MRDDKNKKNYWRSLEDRSDDPNVQKFEEEEFPDLASEKSGPLPRRSFLKIMGASAALASGTTGCRFPQEKIVPAAGRPVGRDPGVPLHFTTAFEMGGYAQGLLVKSVDGRPIKIEGNPKHPLNKGATNAWAQASLLDLYDPGRSKHPIEINNGKETSRTWDEFKKYIDPIINRHKAKNGQGLAIISSFSGSPSLNYIEQRLFNSVSMGNLNQAQVCHFNPLSFVTGDYYSSKFDYNLKNANVIVSIDSDILYSGASAVRYAREFAEHRLRQSQNKSLMNRLYCIESNYSVTGSMSDIRLSLKKSKIERFALLLVSEIHKRINIESLQKTGIEDKCKAYNFTDEELELANIITHDLINNRGNCVLICGKSMSVNIQAICVEANLALESLNKTFGYNVEYYHEYVRRQLEKRINYNTPATIQSLTQSMDRGEVETLAILGENPVYNTPVDIGFLEALQRVPNTIQLGIRRNETSDHCDWHLPQAHYLETWGDSTDSMGHYCIVQPMISPLYNGKSILEMLSLLFHDKPKTGYELVKETFDKRITYEINSFDETKSVSWERTLADGYIKYIKDIKEQPGIGTLSEHYFDNIPAATDTIEINFVTDNRVYDGRFANNAWLQEMPDPITKLTWGNAALMSPATAEEHGIKRGDVIKLNYKGRSLDIPALPLPGHADGAVSVPLGYGRTKCGSVGEGVGANAYSIRTSDAPWFGSGLTIEKTGKTVELATTQEHQKISAIGEKEKEKRRPIHIREADFEYFKKNPDFAQHMVHHPPLKSLWKEHEYKGYRWGMAIDLSRCIGCNTCMVACQAENNIPVVGKKEVLLGREMHWIRLDRYFSGNPANPKVSFQPVPCQQCENAPCEAVCPVGATVHSSEGLNDMVYNRCIGMRFCSNNCPYKVRRFNYYLNHKGVDDIRKMIFNPEVTVRSRGVMEKCTYCVQRIQAAKIKAKNERRKLRDGEVVTACAQACPTGAIVFGDLNDPESRVRKLHEDDRAYAVLAEYNLKPRTAYLAKIRNPAPGTDDSGHDEDGHG